LSRCISLPTFPDNVDGKVSYIRIPNRRRKYFDRDTVSCVANLANLAPEEKSQILRNIRNSYDVDVEEDTFHDLLAVDRLYQFIKAEKPYFRKGIVRNELERIWYVVPKLSNRRIIAQRGAFLIFGLLASPPPQTPDDPIQFWGIKVLRRKKAAIRAELNLLGINQSALFPEIDRAARDIVARFS
jgi:hypothetical protein